ncbi:MAG: ribonuclease P protein component [Vampirovibrio sp.]
MFSKPFRLQASWFFNKTLREGIRYYACPFFVIMVLPHWHAHAQAKAQSLQAYRPRIGFVVSKKVHKRAVKRNRLKRMVREWIRQNVWVDSTNPWQGVASLAVVFRPEAMQVPEAEVLARVHHAFSPAQLKRLEAYADDVPRSTHALRLH